MGQPSPFVVGVVVLLMGVAIGFCSTEPALEIQTEAPPPRPDAHVEFKDCHVYVFGELRGIRKHGETWHNDGSDCEICTCTDGQERCLVHYCNSGLKEGYMTPPSVATPEDKNPADQPPAGPPLDDEDVVEEGSGSRSWEDGYYNVVKETVEDDMGRGKTVSADTNRFRDEKNPQDNETHDPHMSNRLCPSMPCRKTCPHGYKVDPITRCRKCKCFKCPSLRSCYLKCHDGYAVDERGCRTCQCRNQGAKVSVITSVDDNDFIVEDGYGMSSEVFSNSTYSEVMEGVYVKAEEEPKEPDTSCNTTQSSRTHQPYLGRGHESRSTSRVPLDRMPPTLPHDRHDPEMPEEEEVPAHRNEGVRGDGSTTKSAVQASPADWSQVCVILVPVLVISGLVATLIVHFWRRSHRDKYDINAYRPDEREKLRPVKTADDHQTVRHV